MSDPMSTLMDLADEDLRAGADDIVDAWLAALPEPSSGRPRSSDLLAGYRALARAALGHGLAPGAAVAGGDEALDTPDFRRLLAHVAAANRRASLSISDLLDDLRVLILITVSSEQTRAGATEPTVDLVRATTRAVLTLDLVGRRIVRVLEGIEARAEREGSEALSAMTDMVSHELRNRLGAARTASQMLASPSIALNEAGLRRAAELVQGSLEAALSTVDDVRALAVTRSNAAHPRPQTVDLSILIRAIIEKQRAAALEAGVELETDGKAVDCRVDAARMRLIVFNLISNGIKYRDETEERPYVRVRCELRTGDRVAVIVSDNGIGIPPEEIDDVFLYRVRGSEADRVPGSGLGLAIVGEAVDQLGAEITVVSDPEVGSTFTLLFTPFGKETAADRSA
jgi:signal transduction histidine kinase